MLRLLAGLVNVVNHSPVLRISLGPARRAAARYIRDITITSLLRLS
jgi:hypothetical protein